MRQLTAIMFADIMGYTAMMQENEMNAMRIREKFRKALDREVMAHHGRIIQYSGDGALCSFNSAIDAVRCGIAIQQEMRDDPQVPLRIGIHSGGRREAAADQCLATPLRNPIGSNPNLEV